MASDTLNYYLGKMYSADVLGKGSLDDVKSAFAQLLGAGTPLELDARNEMARLSGIPNNRCYVSRKHLEYLQSLLK